MKLASLRSPSLGLLMASLVVACGGGGGGSDAADTGTVISAAPSAVSDVVATPADQSIVLSFKVSNPQNVTGFDTECTSSTETVKVHTDSHGTASDDVLVTGLHNTDTYSCTVSAVNSSGTSTAASAAAVTAGAASTSGTPAAPGSVVVTAGATSAVISFAESSTDGGTAVSSYLGVCLAPDKVSYSYAAASPIVVLGLTPGVPHTCWSSALNAVGAGKASAAAVVTPLAGTLVAAGAPAAPTGIAVTRSAGAAIVAFNTGSTSASASKRRAKGTATESGDLYRATCYIDSQVVTVESSASPITVPQLKNGEEHHCVVTRVTPAGTSADSGAVTVTPATVPGAPTLTDAIGGDTTATIGFTAPATDGGSPITGYRVSCIAGEKLAKRDTGPDARSVLVAGLVNGTAYGCSVAAVNDVGAGAASATQTVTALAAPVSTGTAAPSAPQAVQATAGNGSVAISFTPVTDSSSPVVDYTVTCTSATEQVSQTGTTSPITVNGLDDGVPYDCVVTARTETGTVSSASAAQTVTLAVTAPPAPVLLSVTPGNASIAVAFDAGSGAGSPASSHAATCGDVRSPSAASSPITVSGLKNGSIYACWVEATNTAGSTRSVESKSTKPRTTPQAPTNVRAEAGNASITLSYQAPADDGGADISGYTANCRNGTRLWAVDAAGKDTYGITVTELTNGDPYECKVFARNVAGSGEPSTAILATPSAGVVETAPAMASDVAISSVGSGELTVSFTRPSANGSDVSYALVCSPGDINKSAGTASSVKATGLANGTPYACLVRATRGSLSTDSATITGTPNALPLAPALSVSVGDRTLNYSFTPVAGETYAASCTGGTVGGIDNGKFSVTELTNGVSYGCSVTATNSAGSSTSQAAATPGTTPGAPTLSMTAGPASAGNASLTVTVGAPAQNGGASIDSYKLICDGGLSFSPSPSSLSKTFTGLPNNKTYSCSVKAHNSFGDGSQASASATTSVTAPSAPGLTVTPGTSSPGNAALNIVVSAPLQNGGSAIASYGLSCTAGSTVQTATVSNMVATVNGLPNGTAYSCTVTVTNQANLSSAATATGTTAITVPSMPTVSWTAQCGKVFDAAVSAGTSTGGSPITEYVLTLREYAPPSYGGGLMKTDSDVILGANGGTRQFTGGDNYYEVTVKARNAVGDSAPYVTNKLLGRFCIAPPAPT